MLKWTFYYTSHNGMESSFLEVLQMRIIILFSILWTLKGSYFLITYLTLIWNPFLWRISDKNWSIVFCWKKAKELWNMCPGFFQPLALVWFLHTNGFFSSVWYVSRNPYSTYKSTSRQPGTLTSYTVPLIRYPTKPRLPGTTSGNKGQT